MDAIISWTEEEDGPRILAIFDKLSASGHVLNHNTYPEFEQIVGRPAAEAALGRYYRELEEDH